MSDEEIEEATLDEEQLREVVEWAVGTGVMVTLMKHHPDHDDEEEALERLEGYMQAIEIMYDSIPDCLIDVTHGSANEIIEDAVEKEEIVEEFLKEIEKL